VIKFGFAVVATVEVGGLATVARFAEKREQGHLVFPVAAQLTFEL